MASVHAYMSLAAGSVANMLQLNSLAKAMVDHHFQYLQMQSHIVFDNKTAASRLDFLKGLVLH